MDLPGLICFFWAIAFCIACGVFQFTTWREWDVTEVVTDETWRNTPKGLALAPPIIALVWPSQAVKFSLDPVPLFFWERLALLAAGIFVGTMIVRALKQER